MEFVMKSILYKSGDYTMSDNFFIRNTLRSVIFPVLILLTMAVPSLAKNCLVSSKDRNIWFSPESHYPPVKGVDFLELFQKDAQWDDSAKRINVFKLSTQFFMDAPSTVIHSVVSTLKDKKIKLAIEAEVGCGRLPGTPKLAEIASENISEAGGTLAFVALDEPLWHLYFDPSSRGCHIPIEAASHRTAAIVAVYRKYFPDVDVGEIEPFPVISNQPDWAKDLKTFVNDLRQDSGPVTFLHLDFNWLDSKMVSRNSVEVNSVAVKNQTQAIAGVAKNLNLRVGVIYDGTAVAKSNVEWLQQAERHASAVESTGLDPHDVIFQSWHTHPTKTLPEDNSDSFLNLVIRFCSADRRYTQ